MEAKLSAFHQAWVSVLPWKAHGSLHSPWLPKSPVTEALPHRSIVTD